MCEDPQVKSKAAEFKTSLYFCPVIADSVILYFLMELHTQDSMDERSVELIKLICKFLMNASFSCYPLDGQ